MELSDWRSVLDRAQRTREIRSDVELEGARKLARVLDRGFVDPILGFLLPGVGDLAGSAMGLYLVVLAVRKQLPGIVIARMLLNLAFDALLGAVPIVGDLFDVVFRANMRNLALLEARHVEGRASKADWAYVMGAVVLFLGALAVPILLASWAIARLHF